MSTRNSAPNRTVDTPLKLCYVFKMSKKLSLIRLLPLTSLL